MREVRGMGVAAERAERAQPQTDIAAQLLAKALAGEPRLCSGHVWLVGAGPSDPSQLTLQALAALIQAEVVVHDALVDPRVLALIPSTTERIFVGKRGGMPSTRQEDICDLLIRLARERRKVIRLKGGDPHVFGRGGEEILALAEARIPFRVVPGLTSGLAALTAAGIPATLRGVNQTLVLVTGHGADPDAADAPKWALLARLGEPLVIYMALRNIAAIARALMEGGLTGSVPAAAVGSVGTAQESVVVAPISELAQAVAQSEIQAPAIVVVGEIVRHRVTLQSLLATLPRDNRSQCDQIRLST
jgi:uroporphyrin-III C-methyltransferase